MKRWTHYSFWGIYVLALSFFGGLEVRSDFLHFREDPEVTVLIVFAGSCVWLLFYLMALLPGLVFESGAIRKAAPEEDD